MVMISDNFGDVLNPRFQRIFDDKFKELTDMIPTLYAMPPQNGRNNMMWSDVGAVEDFTFRGNKEKAFFGNPWNVNAVVQNSSRFLSHELPSRTVRVGQYGVFTNNCQHHAYAVLQDLGLR